MFTPLKLLLLLFLIIIVWYVFSIIEKKPVQKDSDENHNELDSLEQCEVCKDYCEIDAIDCGKKNCPFPK